MSAAFDLLDELLVQPELKASALQPELEAASSQPEFAGALLQPKFKGPRVDAHNEATNIYI